MNRRYELVSNRQMSYDCMDADCDRKTYWTIESSNMRYRAAACRGHLGEVCEEIIAKGDIGMRIARWG